MTMSFCSNCGAQLPPIESLRFCPNCGATVSTVGPGAAPPPPSPAESEPIPFDDISRLGFFPALWLTWKEIMFEPTRFFTRARANADPGWAILFAMLIGTASAFGQRLEALATRPFTQEAEKMARQMFSQFYSAEKSQWEKFFDLPSVQIFGTIAQPLYILIALLILSAIFHVGLAVFGGARSSFSHTMRAVAFCYAPSVVALVPCLGQIIAPIWSTVLAIIGLSRVHETDTWRAACAVLLPPFLLCGLCCGGMLFLAVLARSATGGGF